MDLPDTLCALEDEKRCAEQALATASSRTAPIFEEKIDAINEKMEAKRARQLREQGGVHSGFQKAA